MKLLIVTQAVDQSDPVLGFFHEWLVLFAEHVETLTVICLYEGEHSLPANVRVHSLGKERGRRPFFSYAISFKLLAWKLRREYDSVFVHMNPEYLLIAGPMWKILGKRTALWYLHKSVTWRLRLGVLFADAVLTASEGSMRLVTRKKRVVGHGIDAATLTLTNAPPYPPLALLTVGRLSPVKRVHMLIEAFAFLRKDGIEATFTVAGGPAGPAGTRYERELKEQAQGLGVADRIVFLGPVAHAELASLFAESHLFLHASATGSLDKASLEPLAAGVPLITTDTELASVGVENVFLAEASADALAGAVRRAIGERAWDKSDRRAAAHAYVLEHHELSRLIPRILAIVNPNYGNSAGE
jgi:glycosyltransferase involved in cell wall biosynthesis